MFSVVAVELLPDIVARHAPYEVALGFGLGVGTMLGLRYFTQRLEASEGESADEPAGRRGAGRTGPAGCCRPGAALGAAAGRGHRYSD